MGCHPADIVDAPHPHTSHLVLSATTSSRRSRRLASRGVEFTGPVVDQGYGLVTHFRVPGGFEVQL